MSRRPWQRDRALEARLPARYRLDTGGDDDPGLHEDGHGAPKRPRVRYMPPLEAPLLSQVATVSGFLRKQADNEPGKWTKYYFVLKPSTYLYYYNTEHDADPRGIIDLDFLTDVRFNADCVQRSVGGSAHGFRVTGQLPPLFSGGGTGTQAAQLRPVYLDAESRDEADAWMDAIRHHRFDLDRHNDYDDLLATMDAADNRLTGLTEQTNRLWTTSHSLLRKASGYLCQLRGTVAPDDASKPLYSTAPKSPESTEEALRSVNTLLDEIFAEGERQRRLVEILRERENEHFQREALLKTCEADYNSQTLRCQQLEREIERMLEDRQEHDRIYETRYATVISRELEVVAWEKELQELAKQRDRDFEHQMRDLQKLSLDLENKRKKEAAAVNAELVRQRKTLEKQQKALEKKQKLVDRRLQEKPTLKSGFVATVYRSFPSTSPKRAVPTTVESTGSCEKESDRNLENDRQDTSDNESSKSVTEEEHCDDVVSTEPAKENDQEGDTEVVDRSADEDGGTPEVQEARFTSGGLSSLSSSDSNRSSDVVDKSSLAEPHSVRGPAHSIGSDAPSVAVLHDLAADTLIGRLPPEWTCKESKSYEGRVYYFNIFTGETRWDFPLDVVDNGGCGEQLDDTHALTGDASGRVINLESDKEEAGNVPAPSKTPWRNKLMAKVVYLRTEGTTPVSAPPRSLLDEPEADKTERCEF